MFPQTPPSNYLVQQVFYSSQCSANAYAGTVLPLSTCEPIEIDNFLNLNMASAPNAGYYVKYTATSSSPVGYDYITSSFFLDSMCTVAAPSYLNGGAIVSNICMSLEESTVSSAGQFYYGSVTSATAFLTGTNIIVGSFATAAQCNAPSTSLSSLQFASFVASGSCVEYGGQWIQYTCSAGASTPEILFFSEANCQGTYTTNLTPQQVQEYVNTCNEPAFDASNPFASNGYLSIFCYTAPSSLAPVIAPTPAPSKVVTGVQYLQIYDYQSSASCTGTSNGFIVPLNSCYYGGSNYQMFTAVQSATSIVTTLTTYTNEFCQTTLPGTSPVQTLYPATCAQHAFGDCTSPTSCSIGGRIASILPNYQLPAGAATLSYYPNTVSCLTQSASAYSVMATAWYPIGMCLADGQGSFQVTSCTKNSNNLYVATLTNYSQSNCQGSGNTMTFDPCMNNVELTTGANALISSGYQNVYCVPTSTATTTSSSSSASGLSSASKVAIGLAIGLGIPLIAALGVVAYLLNSASSTGGVASNGPFGINAVKSPMAGKEDSAL